MSSLASQPDEGPATAVPSTSDEGRRPESKRFLGSRGPRKLPSRIPRHLHRAGPHTLAVSLPKAWLDRHELELGSAIWLFPREDGRLEIDPVTADGMALTPERVLSVESPHFGEPDVLARTVFGGYVVGHDRIELIDSEGFDPERQMEVERSARSLVGMQVVYHDKHRISVQSFLDPRRHTVPQVLSRTGRVVEEMVQLLGRAIETTNEVPLAELNDREAEADRLYALALRQLMLAHRDPVLARALDVRESPDYLGSRVVGKVFEEMADLLARSGPELAGGLRGKPISPGLRTNLGAHAAILRTMVQQASRSVRQKDSALAHRVLDRQMKGSVEFDATEDLLGQARIPNAQRVHLARFVWSLGTVRRYCGSIAEVALNESIRSTGSRRNLDSRADFTSRNA